MGQWGNSFLVVFCQFFLMEMGQWGYDFLVVFCHNFFKWFQSCWFFCWIFSKKLSQDLSTQQHQPSLLPIAIAPCHCPWPLPITIAHGCECQFFTRNNGSMWTGSWEREHGDLSMQLGDGSVDMGQWGNFFPVVFCHFLFDGDGTVMQFIMLSFVNFFDQVSSVLQN